MKQELTYEQEEKLIGRAVGYSVIGLSPHEYGTSVKKALVKALLKNTEYRRELRRLNQTVRHVKALEEQNTVLEQEVACLTDLLDKEDEENADTDPAPPEFVAVSVNQSGGITTGVMQESYNEWDMRTRYPNLIPRGDGLQRSA